MRKKGRNSQGSKRTGKCPIYFRCHENKIKNMKFIELSIPQLPLAQGGVNE